MTHRMKTVLLCLSLCLSSCYSLTLQSASDREIMLSGQKHLQPQSYRVIRHFYHTREIHFVFGVPLSEDSDRLLSQVLEKELLPQQQVINLSVQRFVSPLSQVNTLLTLGLYLKVKVIVEGDIIEKR